MKSPLGSNTLRGRFGARASSKVLRRSEAKAKAKGRIVRPVYTQFCKVNGLYLKTLIHPRGKRILCPLPVVDQICLDNNLWWLGV